MTLLEHNPEDEASIPEDLTTDDEELEAMLVAMRLSPPRERRPIRFGSGTVQRWRCPRTG